MCMHDPFMCTLTFHLHVESIGFPRGQIPIIGITHASLYTSYIPFKSVETTLSSTQSVWSYFFVSGMYFTTMLVFTLSLPSRTNTYSSFSERPSHFTALVPQWSAANCAMYWQIHTTGWRPCSYIRYEFSTLAFSPPCRYARFCEPTLWTEPHSN